MRVNIVIREKYKHKVFETTIIEGVFVNKEVADYYAVKLEEKYPDDDIWVETFNIS